MAKCLKSAMWAANSSPDHYDFLSMVRLDLVLTQPLPLLARSGFQDGRGIQLTAAMTGILVCSTGMMLPALLEAFEGFGAWIPGC
jgi:hypothetical protein